MTHPLILGVLLALLGACTTGPSATAPTSPRATPTADTASAMGPAAEMPDDVACRWGVGDDVRLPRSLDGRQVELVGHPPVPLETAMDWENPPYDHPSWGFALHNLQWTYHLVTGAAAGDADAAELLDEVYRSWSATNAAPADAPNEQTWSAHAVALRTQVMTCAVHLLDLEPAEEILAAGVDWLRADEHFDGLWNHGVDQSIALLMAGCVLEDDDAIRVAVDRLDQHREGAIDDQGVTNEQATGYQEFVHDQYGAIARVMDGCGLDAERFRAARTAMLPMLVHATRPGGALAPFGDTHTQDSGIGPDAHPDVATGLVDQPPRSAAYDRGYAFGRDAWTSEAAWFGMRFGEGRIIHGHRDHASLLYDVLGTPLLAEGGFSGYRPGPWRSWERSHVAHNVVAVDDGGRFLWDHETPLVHEDVHPDAISLTVEGRPYTAIERHRRAVLVSFAPHALVVHDIVTAPSSIDAHQLWHLPGGWEVMARTATETTAAGPDGIGLRVVQLATAAVADVIEGREEPIQGWVATGVDERVPAPVLDHAASGSEVEYVTVLVPTGQSLPAVDVARRGDRVVLTAGGEQATVRMVAENLELER